MIAPRPLPEPVCDVADHADPVAAVLAAHRDACQIALRTSGSSGDPRAVVRTTRSWWASFGTVTDRLEMTRSSRVWVPGPLSATMNLFAAVHAVDLGATLVPDLAAATHAHLTPTALERLVSERPTDLAGVHVLVAGDRLGPSAHARATDTGARISHYYGSAELSFVAWGSHAGNLRPLPEVEVTLRLGEIWVRSPYLCEGYAGPPGAMRVRDGWATVGDRGEYADGYLTVHGRGLEAVTTGGATVLVDDVEAVLRAAAHGEVYVVPLPRAGLGQLLAAVVTDGSDVARLRRTARETLAASHRPRRWCHVPRPPLTDAGKVDRAALARSLVVAEPA